MIDRLALKKIQFLSPINNITLEIFVWSRMNEISSLLWMKIDYFELWFLYKRDLCYETIKEIARIYDGSFKITPELHLMFFVMQCFLFILNLNISGSFQVPGRLSNSWSQLYRPVSTAQCRVDPARFTQQM